MDQYYVHTTLTSYYYIELDVLVMHFPLFFIFKDCESIICVFIFTVCNASFEKRTKKTKTSTFKFNLYAT